MSDNEMRPCPWCGSANIEVNIDPDDSKYYGRAKCVDCGTASPDGSGWVATQDQAEADARADWNDRPALTDEQVHLIASRIACDRAGQIDWDTLEDKRSHIDMMTAAGEAAIREAMGRGERG